MPRIILHAPGRLDSGFNASPVDSVLVSAQRAGAVLRHDCGGKALCGTCRVRVLSGKGSPAGSRELLRLEAVGAGPGTRLACQLHPGTDMELEALLPPAGTDSKPTEA